MRRQELSNEVQHVVRYAVLVINRIVRRRGVREARSDGLVDEDHVGRDVPAVRVL